MEDVDYIWIMEEVGLWNNYLSLLVYLILRLHLYGAY